MTKTKQKHVKVVTREQKIKQVASTSVRRWKSARQLASRSQIERWNPPIHGSIKCNIHANWKNAVLHSDVAWIARDSDGRVRFHSREAFTCSANRMIAELRCIIWLLQSVRDLHFDHVFIASDHKDTIAAILAPNHWPSFEEERVSANLIARDVAKSVLRDGRFHSYLAMGGPAWLHERLRREATSDI
ncbi:unnamed protein product [Brassica oleracea var. botrytis]|uniref:RNase H type-1 domain-containing protein n=2 Tax=Brassica oleracea TaxID=3712 RepID=A0A0D3BZC5_BRAOL|nr:unnamed protein product [Brassica oleracea]